MLQALQTQNSDTLRFAALQHLADRLHIEALMGLVRHKDQNQGLEPREQSARRQEKTGARVNLRDE
jgi:hypothetical protein